MNEAELGALLQMDIDGIRKLEKLQENFNKDCREIIERQKETVASAIEREKIDDDWANKFIEELNE